MSKKHNNQKSLFDSLETKICKQCGESKSLNEFSFNHKSTSRQARCRVCRRTAKSKEHIAAYNKKWNAANKAYRREYDKKYHKLHPKTVEQKKKSAEFNRKNGHKYSLKKTFRMTIDDYNKLLKAQNGGCAICGSKNARNKTRRHFFVDHCHKTGAIRGLLCHHCNTGLGMFQDNPALLQNGIAYLAINGKKQNG